MKTIIIYASQHGCAEKCANDLKTLLNNNAEVANLKKGRLPDLTSYDRIILGGSIHAGKVQRKVKQFVQKYGGLLLTKKLGLYLCCMEENEKAKQQFDNAFPVELRNHATAIGMFGGEFDFERMNFIERAIIRKIAKLEQSVSKIDQEKIRMFARAMG
ncbi:flavodoxin [candidate division KSB1 bacterium]|nr:flavodoxin [candidate division KSB1 bacterium]